MAKTNNRGYRSAVRIRDLVVMKSYPDMCMGPGDQKFIVYGYWVLYSVDHACNHHSGILIS